MAKQQAHAVHIREPRYFDSLAQTRRNNQRQRAAQRRDIKEVLLYGAAAFLLVLWILARATA